MPEVLGSGADNKGAVMNHVWGCFSHPDREMRDQQRKRKRFASLYPPCTADGGNPGGLRVYRYYTNRLEFWRWQYPNYLLTGICGVNSVLRVMLAGVAVMGRVIWWMARNCPQRPSLAHCMVFLRDMSRRRCFKRTGRHFIRWSGCALVGTVALFYTGYLLYLGIPTFPEYHNNGEEGLKFFQFDAGDRCAGTGSSCWLLR